MPDPTVNLGLEILAENQAAAEVTFNESMYKLDAIVQGKCISRTLVTPPLNPSTGDVYIVGVGTQTDEWIGKENYIAYSIATQWKFVPPVEGMQMWNMATGENSYVFYDGNSWELARMDSISGHISSPSEQIVCLDLAAAEPYKTIKLWGMTGVGTCTIQLRRGSGTTHNQTGNYGNSLSCTTSRSSESTVIGNILKEYRLALDVTSVSGDCVDLTFGVEIIRSVS